MINDRMDLIADSFVVPDEALSLVPVPLLHTARTTRELPTPVGMLR